MADTKIRNRKINGSNNRFRSILKEQRRTEAAYRTANWQKLSPQEQLVQLDARLGEGIGAKKQRARIQAQMEEK
jgi:hypothetical protein